MNVIPCPVCQAYWLYTPIAFDERVTFWLQCARSLPCACIFCCIVCVCDCVMVIRKPTRKYCNIRTWTRQSPDTLKPKSYSLVEGNQTIVYASWLETFTFAFTMGRGKFPGRGLCMSYPVKSVQPSVKFSSICLMTRHFYLCLYHGKGEVPGERFKHILPCQVCPAFC